MIYSREFVWIHFPKCAGTTIEYLFEEYLSKNKNLFQDPVGIEEDPSIAWHDSIAQREARDSRFRLGKRIVIFPFRRLPSWLESRYSFEFKRSSHLPHRPELLLEGKFLESDGAEGYADDYARKYMPRQILESGSVRFLRTEFFEADFKAVFGEFVDISRIPEREFKRKVNASEPCLPESVRRQLYDEAKKVYDNCPYWRALEEAAYGCRDA